MRRLDSQVMKLEEKMTEEYTIREAVPEDAQEFLLFTKLAGAETDNLTFGPEGLPLTIRQEQDHLLHMQEEEHSVFYLAFENGKIPIAPHIYLPQFMAEETEREAALATGFRFLDICAEIWVCGDRISEGMEREIAHAESAMIPVRYIGGVSCTRLKKD